MKWDLQSGHSRQHILLDKETVYLGVKNTAGQRNLGGGCSISEQSRNRVWTWGSKVKEVKS